MDYDVFVFSREESHVATGHTSPLKRKIKQLAANSQKNHPHFGFFS
jgi:hypothetical protein